MTSYYSETELADIGLSEFGKDVKISRKTSIYNPQSISIGDNVRIDDFCFLSGNISLGSHIHIAPFSGLWGTEEIIMRDFTGLAPRVSIFASSEDYSGGSLTNPTVPEEYRPGLEYGDVELNKHVIIGANTVLLPNVRLEQGVAIGAQSLVKENISEWEVHIGNPLEKVGERNKDQIIELEEKFLKEFEY